MRSALDGLEDREDVVRHRELAEDRRLLRQVGDAEPRAPVHRQVGDLLLAEKDASPVGRTPPDDHVEGRGLAGAVRTEQPDDLARRRRCRSRRRTDLALAVALAQSARGEDRLAHGFAFGFVFAGAAFASAAGFLSLFDGITFTVAPPRTFTRFCLMKISISLAADAVVALLQFGVADAEQAILGLEEGRRVAEHPALRAA